MNFGHALIMVLMGFFLGGALLLSSNVNGETKKVKQINFGGVTCRSLNDVDICEFKANTLRFCKHGTGQTAVVVDCAIYDDMVK